MSKKLLDNVTVTNRGGLRERNVRWEGGLKVGACRVHILQTRFDFDITVFPETEELTLVYFFL